jgi:RNA polymerase sigma-70 factor (ECF subfamily)
MRSATPPAGTDTDTLAPVTTTLETELEAYRRELTGYCYRMLGSNFEAEDAVQEAMVRAWRNIDTFEGRSALKSWLYKIATNVCLDMLRGSQRRARPMDMGPSAVQPSEPGPMLPETTWVEPLHDAKALGPESDPAELAEYRESVRLAFVAALQHLPARQRAVLILREVLRWQASEVAELLDSTVASVNSALQRARATLDGLKMDAAPSAPDDPKQLETLQRYVEAFERYDVDSLVTLLHDEVRFSMPPYALWLNSPEEVGRWMLGPGHGCRGSKMVAISVNGLPGFAQYRPAGAGAWEPWSIQVLEITDGVITEVNNFLDTKLFASFGLPPRITE